MYVCICMYVCMYVYTHSFIHTLTVSSLSWTHCPKSPSQNALQLRVIIS